MKNLFVIGFFLWVQPICIASDEAQEMDIAKTYNRYLERDTGVAIYYPKEYGSYQKFKENYLEKDYVEQLLAERLGLIDGAMKSRKKLDSSNYDDKDEDDYERYRSDLIFNEIALRSNAATDVLDSISFCQDDISDEALYKQSDGIKNLLRSKVLKDAGETTSMSMSFQKTEEDYLAASPTHQAEDTSPTDEEYSRPRPKAMTDPTSRSKTTNADSHEQNLM